MPKLQLDSDPISYSHQWFRVPTMWKYLGQKMNQYRKTWHKGKVKLEHRLIAEREFGPIPSKMVVNHKNGDRSDNRLENLEVVTQSQNCQHAWDTGLHKTPIYERYNREGCPKAPNYNCRVCDHKWSGRVKRPKSCPRCKSYFWMEPLKEEVKSWWPNGYGCWITNKAAITSNSPLKEPNMKTRKLGMDERLR